VPLVFSQLSTFLTQSVNFFALTLFGCSAFLLLWVGQNARQGADGKKVKALGMKVNEMSYQRNAVFVTMVVWALIAGCGPYLPPGPDGKPVRTWRQIEREEKQRFAWARREATDSASYFLRNEEKGKPDLIVTYYLGERDGNKDVVIAHSFRQVPKGNFWGVAHYGIYDSFAPLRSRFDKDSARTTFVGHTSLSIDSMALVFPVPDPSLHRRVSWHIWTAGGEWYLFIDNGSVLSLEELIKWKEEDRRLWNSGGKRR